MIKRFSSGTKSQINQSIDTYLAVIWPLPPLCSSPKVTVRQDYSPYMQLCHLEVKKAFQIHDCIFQTLFTYVRMSKSWMTSCFLPCLVDTQRKCLRSRPKHNYSVGTRVLGTPCLSQKGDLMGRCFDRDRKNRGPVSQQAWHDKDPSIHKAKNRRAN